MPVFKLQKITFAKYCISLLLLVVVPGLSIKSVKAQNKTHPISDEQLLDKVQKDVLKYFWELAEPKSLMARDYYSEEDIYPGYDKNTVVTGGTGFGLMTILVGIERKFIPRNEAVDRINHILDYLTKASRNHGVWSHRIFGETGKSIEADGVVSGEDVVETAFLTQGMICVREYFKNGSTLEKALAEKCDKLWKEINWDYFTNGEKMLYWWFPANNGQMNFPLEGYNECLIAYVLAASSPTFPIDPECFSKGWTRNGAYYSDKKAYNIPIILKHNLADEKGGPLFWAHYSYLGLDPDGLSDGFINYWDLNRNHVRINYFYCQENPKKFKGYSPIYWGLTASFSRQDSMNINYEAHQPNHDLGVITPTAALSSFPYTPKESMEFLRFLYEEKPEFIGEAGPYDATSIHYNNWVVPAYNAIDQGTIAPMIENYRTGLLWNLFMNAPEIKSGLKRLGFKSTKHNLN